MNVRDTVQDALQKQGVPLSPQYQGYADHVIRALETREAEIVANLISYASEQGLDRETAINALDDCGLETSQTTAVAGEDPRIAEMEAQMAAMQETLRQLRG
jgi:hypothetical protein